MKHHLIVGTWTPPGAIFVLLFDDEKLTLELVKRIEIPQEQPVSWITFDHARKNIYGAGMKKWGSYSIQSPTEIAHSSSFPIGGNPRANDADTRTRAIFALAAQKPPHNVYACPFYDHAGFINVFAVDAAGAMTENIQNAPLDEKSAVHGMVFDSNEEYLYSADMWGNKLWCHKKDPQTGELELVGSVTAPDPNDHPRWVEMHPSDTHLYALMESNNRVCIYTVDPTTHLPTYTSTSYPLLPPDFLAFHPKQYRGDVVYASSSGRYLFASTRSNSPGKLTGYLTAFALDPTTGAVQRQILLQPTPTSGGHSNAVAPCPWSDEWVALCDDEVGFVELYRWKDEVLGRVARCEVREPGFGMNAIWYD